WRRSKLLHLVVQQSSRHCCLSIGYIGPDGERKHRGYGSQSTRHNGGSDHYFNQCESTIRQRVIRLGLEKGRASETLKRCHAEINTVTVSPPNYLRLRAAALALRGAPTVQHFDIAGGHRRHRPPLQLRPTPFTEQLLALG